MARSFKLEHARQALLMRQFALVIEKKTIEICLSNEKGDCLDEVVSALRALLTRLDELIQPCSKQFRETNEDCDHGYEKCNDGVCRAWCS